MRTRLLAGTAAGALGLAAVALTAEPASAADDAALSVLHGVADLTVDVYVNGELRLDDFEPGKLAGPLDLPAGTYTVAITAADAADDSDPAIGPVDLDLAAGTSYTAVAHLDASGEPTATLFTNDTSTTAAGEGRLTVRHVAAAPADRADRQPFIHVLGPDHRLGRLLVADEIVRLAEDRLAVWRLLREMAGAGAADGAAPAWHESLAARDAEAPAASAARKTRRRSCCTPRPRIKVWLL